MALTKLPKNAFATGSVDDSKIEDGTIQNVELEDGTLTSEKFETGTIANASLSNSSITINGTSVSLGGSTTVSVDVNWQSVQTTGFTAVAGNGYFIDTTSDTHTLNLPASATLGDQIAIKDYAGTFGSNKLTIGRNGHNIQGAANDSLISTNRASLLLVYVDSTKGWIYAEESNVADLQAATFITATGGTVTTSGDYKIHSFTGDGCFVVSQVGNPAGGPSVVDYLVVAGGAGGSTSGGGGGGGGFRESHSAPISGCYSASPLATCTGLTITATTYPISVGAGGGGANCVGVPGGDGTPSIFSTITSAGGGGGGGTSTGCNGFGNPGGSGGGGGVSNFNAIPGGTGNTPPVSPPQGNNGGNTNQGSPFKGSGGGGAAAAGGNHPGPAAGGAGTPSSASGSPTTYSGGGTVTPSTSNGGSNTGNGGTGFPWAGAPTAGAGGSGIVIIRYKFQ